MLFLFAKFSSKDLGASVSNSISTSITLSSIISSTSFSSSSTPLMTCNVIKFSFKDFFLLISLIFNLSSPISSLISPVTFLTLRLEISLGRTTVKLLFSFSKLIFLNHFTGLLISAGPCINFSALITSTSSCSSLEAITYFILSNSKTVPSISTLNS